MAVRTSAALALGLIVCAGAAAAKPTVTVLHNLYGDTDGCTPRAGVVFDRTGNLYGTTEGCGKGGFGTAFSLTPSGKFEVLHAFKGKPDGAYPEASLLASGHGKLYGTTFEGGDSDFGMVFELKPDKKKVLHSFIGDTDGVGPVAPLIKDGLGNLYSTARYGLGTNKGTIFKIAPDNTFSVLFTFTTDEQGSPSEAGLYADAAGNLYGSTEFGGAKESGTIYKLTPEGVMSVVYEFQGGADGAGPVGALVTDDAGNFYGATLGGGTSNFGTIFKLMPDGVKTTLHIFQGPDQGDGYDVEAPLMAKGGAFYGTTQFGGGENAGTIFKVWPDGTYRVVYSFKTQGDAKLPYAPLTKGPDGALYGTTVAGGAGSGGTIFKLTE
jgi:uncharacterized repeat protein (TIGR03803 family)